MEFIERPYRRRFLVARGPAQYENRRGKGEARGRYTLYVFSFAPTLSAGARGSEQGKGTDLIGIPKLSPLTSCAGPRVLLSGGGSSTRRTLANRKLLSPGVSLLLQRPGVLLSESRESHECGTLTLEKLAFLPRTGVLLPEGVPHGGVAMLLHQ
ncbi:uncharacterized protein [Asterias amurensis]|uniref:uncharacterized protein n=1 Tax=Asterias amurensis TaxID=7602 RepID=UPI003AB74503